MTDTTTFFARISSFFLAFWVYVLRMLSMKHKSTTLCDDLEIGIPSGKRQASGSCPIDGFVDICLSPDSKTTKTDVVSIATHDVPTKAVIKTDIFQPTVKIDRPVPVLFPAVPVIPQIGVIDNRSKHMVVQFGPYSLHENFLQLRSRKLQDSFSDLLDLFPLPPAYIPLLSVGWIDKRANLVFTTILKE